MNTSTVLNYKVTQIAYVIELFSGSISIPYENKIKIFDSKIKCHLRCPICLSDKTRRGRTAPSFRSICSLIKHIRRNHQTVKNIPPTFEQVFLVLESIVVALENNIELDSIKKVVEWRIIVK